MPAFPLSSSLASLRVDPFSLPLPLSFLLFDNASGRREDGLRGWVLLVYGSCRLLGLHLVGMHPADAKLYWMLGDGGGSALIRVHGGRRMGELLRSFTNNL